MVLGGAAAALALSALIDWRRTLQFIGTSGLLFTAALRATSYQQPQVLNLPGVPARLRCQSSRTS